MSIQDESFPIDELMDELDFSPCLLRIQFPHHQRERKASLASLACPATTPIAASEPAATPASPIIAATTIDEIATTINTSTCSSSNDQNLSTESNDRPPSGMSCKTTDANEGSKKFEFSEQNRQKKAVSYQDIHSEYTKRRFKHVESKVGKYIASMKAEDEKRRKAKFQRHSSMPETLSHVDVDANNNRSLSNNDRITFRYTAGELLRLHESTSSDAEADYSGETATSQGTTTTGYGASSRGNNSNNNSSDGQHSGANVLIDKNTFTQLMDEKERAREYSEYLQSKLNDKTGEIVRLKRNVDYMRIELTNAQDKLKLQQHRPSNNRLQTLVQHVIQTKTSKSTQTVPVQTPSPMLLMPQLTPESPFSTPDLNNNNTLYVANNNNINNNNVVRKPTKTVATIQPLSLNFSSIIEQNQELEAGNGGNTILRQRSNSNVSASGGGTQQGSRANNNHNNHNSRSSCPSSSDSAIDIEAIEMASSPSVPPPPQLLLKHKRNSGALAGAGSTQSLHREEFIYYAPLSGRYATLQTLHAGGGIGNSNARSATSSSYTDNADSAGAGYGGAANDGLRKTKKRRRWLRFLGSCTDCHDPNYSLDNSALQQTYTQIPLLEKSHVNHCRNLR